LGHAKYNQSYSGRDQVSSLGSRVDINYLKNNSDSVEVFIGSSDDSLVDLAGQRSKEVEQAKNDGISIGIVSPRPDILSAIAI